MTIRFRSTLALFSSLLIAFAPSGLAEEETQNSSAKKLTELILLPTIHGRHLKSKSYSLERLEEVMRAIKPEIVCSEITPPSLKVFDQGEKDRRLSLFPEYTKVVLPLRKELGYEVIPCSAWTKEVNFTSVGVEKMNEAHFGLIAQALDELEGKGKRVLVTFGGGHIDGLLGMLRLRKDLKIVDYRPTLKKALKEDGKY